MTRPSLEVTMLDVAKLLAKRSTCQKLDVGCVLLDANGRILATGYNGVPSGWVHCKEGYPCNGSCLATHAESNALLSMRGRVQDITICIVTHSPCLACCKQLIQTGCEEILFGTPSEEADQAKEFWRRSGRVWRQIVV